MNLAAYNRFVAALSPIGLRILIAAGVILILDLVAMVVYVFRNGERDEPEKGVTTVHQPMTPVLLNGPGLTRGISKRKKLAGASGLITDESLVDGTATLGQRMMVGGICIFFVSFFLVFLGIGLVSLKDNPLAVFFPIVPGIFLFNFARDAWRDHQKAKAAVAAKRALR
jgi:threonine/homoserine/homoserine lactone efflux protein